jgi:DNA-binding FrmR family transcriptional regulator
MPADQPAGRADLARRLRCAGGHLHGIAAMVERGEDCESLARQTLSVQAALRAVQQRLAHHHLRNCLPAGLLAGDPAEREEGLEQAIRLYALVAEG